MKALVWHGSQNLVYQEVPDSRPGEGESVLDVEVAGICGSDLHGYRGHPGPRVPPLVLGHEVVGRVNGTRYAVYPLIGCGTCGRCLRGEENLCPVWRLIGMHQAGVFAERVVVPDRCLVPLPDEVEARRGVLVEPLACCVGALAAEEIGVGTSLVVIGCGPIGLLAVYLGARRGADVTAVDPVPERLSLARRMGATRFEIEPGHADIAVDAAGFAPTWREAIAAVRSGGHVVVLGLGESEGELPMATVVRRSVHLRGQFAYSRADFSSAMEILGEGGLDLNWLSEAALADGAQAFADLVERPEAHAKILLWP